jgi:hypothetical protein
MFLDWRIIISKRSILLKAVHRFNVIPLPIDDIILNKKNKMGSERGPASQALSSKFKFKYPKEKNKS